MNVKNGISIVQRWWSYTRRHDDEEENRESMAKIARKKMKIVEDQATETVRNQSWIVTNFLCREKT
jgi:hypothetical protein